ncbi:ATP-dependent DNA ligase [Robertmurraya siralis]|uniref:ATP-dependent DNA ligase n=1 Tax=Robertmurraya siralis TaxID=77777 RepID=UPI0010F6F581|nr:RNA ligase family protein [Robertmurraya siralis]
MFVSPMLLYKSDEPFDNDEYVTELKLDGIRLILSKFDNKVKLYTRHNNEVTSKFPELLNINIPNGTVLDGEIVVTDSDGKPDFEAMMERFQSKKSEHKVEYCVFDIIYYDSKKVSLPLLERKELLSFVLKPNDGIFLSQWIRGNAEAYFDLVKQQGLEGIVMKSVNSKYQVGKRSNDWLKVINYQYATVYISGLRKDEFGLLLSVEENGKLKYKGIMEFVTPVAKKEFYKQYRELITKENDKFIYLDPKIKCKVKFRNYTKAGLLRIPSFVEYVS